MLSVSLGGSSRSDLIASARGVMGWVEAQQLSQYGSYVWMVKPRSWKLTSTHSGACTRASPNRRAETRCPSTTMGCTT